MHLEGLRHFDAALRQRLPRIGDGDGVHAAEVFRNGEVGGEPPGGVDLRSSQDLRALGEPFPSKAVAVLDDPAAVDRFPQQIDGPVWRQTVRGGVDLGADTGLSRFARVSVRVFSPAPARLGCGLSGRALSLDGRGSAPGRRPTRGSASAELRIRN